MDFNTINLKKDINGKIDKVFTIIESLKGNKNSLIKLASSELNKKINIKDDTINTNLTYKKAIASQEDDLDNGLDLEEEKITIVSKEIKDPNYEAYITKVAITKNGEKIYMVSFFLTDLYLGRYLINRNLYFLPNNHSQAKQAYNDLISHTKKIRNEYYAEDFANIYIPIKLQNYAIEKSGDFDFKNEDKLGTTVQRTHHNESTVYEWFRTNQEKSEQHRKHKRGE